MSVLHQDPDSTTDPTLSDAVRVRHGFHPCQREQAIQTARCGHQRLGDELGVPTPPVNACVVCMDMRSQPCPFCGRRG